MSTVIQQLWDVYWYCDARMKGERGFGVGATFAEVFFLFFFFLPFYVLALRAQTRPAIEFGSGEEGLRPQFHSPFFFPFIVLVVVDRQGLGVFLWFQLLPLSPLPFGRRMTWTLTP